MNTLQLDGFLAEIDIDETRGLLRGIVVNATEPLKFEGRTIAELKSDFARVVTEFKERSGNNDEPRKPIRPRTVTQHAQMVRNASLRGRKRPPGALDYWTLQEAYDELLAGLYLAHQEFTRASYNGIAGAKSACAKVAWFISCRWENPELASPFLNLFKAFEDVQTGKKPDLFSTRRSVEKRPQTSLHKHLTTFIAALHEADIELGTGAKESAARIALAVNHWPQFKKVQVRAYTVKNWRDRELANAPLERARFDHIVDGILRGPNPRTKIDEFLIKGPPGVPKPSARKS